jgi:tRNA U55 pseudouridine synthase TruB
MPREFMIVCCGKATKLSGYLMDGEKEYIGELLLGYENGYAGSCREKNMFKRRQTPL